MPSRLPRPKAERKPPLVLEVGDLRLMISPSKGGQQKKRHATKRSRPTSRDRSGGGGGGGGGRVSAQPVRSSWLRTAVVLEAPHGPKEDSAFGDDDGTAAAAAAPPPDGADDWKSYVKETRSRMEEMAEEIIHLNAALALTDAQMMSPRGRERGRGAAAASDEDVSDESEDDDRSDESEDDVNDDVSDDVSDGDLHRSRLDESLAESVSEEEVDDEGSPSSSPPSKARDVRVRAPRVVDDGAGGGEFSAPSVPPALSDVGAIASDIQSLAHRDAIIQ